MNRLQSKMPLYYSKSTVIANLTDAEDNEILLFESNIKKTLDQFFIDTADFSLDRWEEDLGIMTNSNKEDAYRKSVIKSKLRGSGTITINLIKEVANSFDNGTVEVEEDNSNYKFIIKFTDKVGVPPNIDDLKDAIEDIKPAHLGIAYELRYYIINEIHNTMTLNSLSEQKIMSFAGGGK